MKCTATKVQAVKTITEPLNIEGAEGVAAPPPSFRQIS